MRRHRQVSAGLLLTGLTLGIVGALPPAAALAVGCSGQVRYASSTNALYLTSGTVALEDLPGMCAAAPIQQTAPGIWELSGDLVVQSGATLLVHGHSAGGQVDTLRLRSLSSNAATQVSMLEAKYGVIDIDGVTVTSWDDATGAPDTDPNVPAGSAPGARGRAFIRALSFLDTSGAHESTMNVRNSDVSHLGYHGAQTYGVAYKTLGCSATRQDVCAAAHVHGQELNSSFHDNFMGTYTFGALGMSFLNNSYYDNSMYGLDPHDDSDYLDIEHNHFYGNGDHGLICSQRCDHLTIKDNESDHNGVNPFPGVTQVHGIMLHRGVTDSVVTGNYVHDNPTGAGIAIFDSSNDTLSGNTLANNKYGVRLSVGASHITVSGNTISNSTSYAFYTYRGGDTPDYTSTGGRPTDNSFTGNTIDTTGSYLARIGDSDNTVFDANTVTGTVGSLRADRSTGTSWSTAGSPANVTYQLRASASVAGSGEATVGASGLLPGSTCTLVVDGKTAGGAAADPSGRVSFVVSSTDTSNHRSAITCS